MLFHGDGPAIVEFLLICSVRLIFYVYLNKNGLEKVDFKSTVVDGLVKVVSMLFHGDGPAIVEFLLICTVRLGLGLGLVLELELGRLG